MAKRRASERICLDIALDMEEPLDRAIALVVALDLMGHGLTGQGHSDGRSLSTVASLALEQLATVKTGGRMLANRR
jgi:hypothetical protein